MSAAAGERASGEDGLDSERMSLSAISTVLTLRTSEVGGRNGEDVADEKEEGLSRAGSAAVEVEER